MTDTSSSCSSSDLTVQDYRYSESDISSCETSLCGDLQDDRDLSSSDLTVKDNRYSESDISSCETSLCGDLQNDSDLSSSDKRYISSCETSLCGDLQNNSDLSSPDVTYPASRASFSHEAKEGICPVIKGGSARRVDVTVQDYRYSVIGESDISSSENSVCGDLQNDSDLSDLYAMRNIENSSTSESSSDELAERSVLLSSHKRKFSEVEQAEQGAHIMDVVEAASGIQESPSTGTSSPFSVGSSSMDSSDDCMSGAGQEELGTSNSESEEECMDNSLYNGSSLSAEQFDALTLAFFKKHHISEAAKEDFLKLIDLTLPEENKSAKSAYSFNKRHSGLKLHYNFLQMCPSCNNEVENTVCRNEDCEQCGQNIVPVTFFVLPLKPQIQRVVRENWKEIEDYRMQMEEETDCLKDIQCGKVYKSFIGSPCVREKKLFSIVVSCDGAPVLKSRALNIWPLMCFLVELPPELRYKMKNILLAGLWYGNSKPDMAIFVKSFVTELTEMSRDCKFEDNNGQLVASLVRIQRIVPDLPAMAMLLNMKQYNGNFGCSVCKHPGSYSKEFKTRVYEYMNDLPLRTAEESQLFSEVAEANHTTIFGVKGKNVFGELISVPDNVQIDWMHCVCEGVLKRQLFTRWFSSEYATENYSLLTIVEELDDIILKVKVPHDLSRKPRSFIDRKKWKASEFRFFLLFTGLPCLRQAVVLGGLPPDNFYHFALLTTAMRHLHSDSATSVSVEIAQLLLDNFVRLFPIFYGSRRVCTYNNHALRHMPKQVLDNGPLSLTSAFVFESFIAQLKRLFSGTRGIPRQMVDRLGVTQSYKAHTKSICKGDTKVENLSKQFLSDTINFTRCKNGIALFHPIVRRKLTQELCTVLNSHLGEDQSSYFSEFQVSFRMKKDLTTYHSLMYPRKGNSCSCVVEYFSKHGTFGYGKVICFILCENIAYALLYKFKMTKLNVCQGIEAPKDLVMKAFLDNNLIGKHFQEAEESTSTPIVIKCITITNRCMFVPFGDGKQGFLTVLDTLFEHD